MHDTDDYTHTLKEFRDKATKYGDRKAARYLLEEFVNHADDIERLVKKPDAVVVSFVASVMREILAGVPPRKALCFDGPGRPPNTELREIVLAVNAYHARQEYKSRTK